MSKPSIKIKQVQYHRNGVGGEGFHVVLFSDKKEAGENMMATVFGGNGQCAVIDLDMAQRGNVGGIADDDGFNCWRGDHFEGELRAAIDAWRDGDYGRKAVDYAAALKDYNAKMRGAFK